MGLTAEETVVVGSFAPRKAEEAIDTLEALKLQPEAIPVVEVRLDALDAGYDLGALRAALPAGRLLATLRSTGEGGAFAGSPEDARRLLRAALDAGFDLADVEWRQGQGRYLLGLPADRVVLSAHDPAGIPGNLDGLCDGMLRTGARYVKIVGTARDSGDALRLLAFQRRRADGRVCAFAMGEAGVATRVLAPYLGATLMFGALAAGRETAPGQLQARDLTDIYGVGRRRPVDRVFALFAGFVTHSLSPVLHNRSFEAHGDTALYVPFALRSLLMEFDALVLGLDGLGLPLRGASVSIPFKDEAATVAVFRGEGVANTLIRSGDAYTAANTDRPALASLVPLAVPGTRALVLGAGGTARTAVEVLNARRYDVFLFSRNPVRAHDAAEDVGASFLANLSPSIPRFSLLVNATPVGLGAGDGLPCPDYLVHEDLTVIDAPYRPGGTSLSRTARARGATVHDGFTLLLEQGARQAELFTGRRTRPADLLEHLPGRHRRLFDPQEGEDVTGPLGARA